MPTAGERRPPAGRYGPAADAEARTDRRLKAVGAVLGAALLAFVVWAGVSYVGGTPVTGELTGFTVVSETEVEATVQVRKPAERTAVCTVRSQAADGLEVGRADFRIADRGEVVHTAVSLRTTGRATSAELLGCDTAPD